MSATDQGLAAQAAADLLAQQPLFNTSKQIACYYAYKDEFATTPLMKAIWQAKKHCYLPILQDQLSLRFVHYDEGDALQANRYSILEPVVTTQQIAPEDLDIVIVPLLAFDKQGHRLGTGGGYYDRTFAFKQAAKKPLLIGLAYADQQAEMLPADVWDVKLDGAVTEKEVIIFNKL